MAADRSASRRSVTPDIAECTTTGRKFAAMRSRSTPAILRQLAADETLVPPNFRTTQFSLFSNTDVNAHGGIADGGRSSRRQKLSHSSSKISRSSFSNCRSASTSSTRLQAALPRLPTATALGRRSARSISGSKSCDSSASPRNSSSMSKCSSSRSLIFREKPLKSIGSISQRHEAAHYIGFCPAFNLQTLHPMRLYSIRGGNPVFQGYYFLILGNHSNINKISIKLKEHRDQPKGPRRPKEPAWVFPVAATVARSGPGLCRIRLRRQR